MKAIEYYKLTKSSVLLRIGKELLNHCLLVEIIGLALFLLGNFCLTEEETFGVEKQQVKN